MPASIEKRYTGGAANADPNASLGGASSSVSMNPAPLNNLFADADPAEAAAGSSKYRAIDILNTGDEEAASVETYMDPITSSPDSELQFGIEGAPLGSTTSIPDEDTAPGGVAFAHYDDASRLALPDIPIGQYCRLWILRVINPGATNTANDQGTINVDFA